MQWTNKVKYQGQVKTAGIGKQMSWKTGFVDFDYDEIRDKWMVKLTFNVNPNRVFHQLQIGHSDCLAVKCGRLMIENKKGDGIHIKLSSDDVDHARQLIAKIQRPAIKAGQHNRAQVGIVSTPSSKISENINPHLNGSLSSDSSPQLSSNDVSPIELENWLPKKTPSSGPQKHPMPVSQRQTEATRSSTNPTSSKPPPPTLPVSSKRRLEYSGAQNNSGSKQNNTKNVYDDADDLLDEIDLTPKRFTAMKAHPKRAQQGTNTMTPGLGTRRFYGSQSTVMKDKFPRDGNSIALAADRSPRIKRAKLTSDLDSNQENYLSGNSPSLGGHNVKMASSGSAEDYSNTEGDSAAQITVGFDNLGNTCFMNSPLQCLSSLEPLSIDFQTAVAEFGPELRPNSITRLLYLLMKDVRKLDVCPERVRQILVRLRHDINGKFALNTQQDAHELLAELLDRTDEEVKAVMGARQAHSDMASGSADGAPSTILADSGASSGTPIQSNFMWFYKTSFYFHECKTEITSSQEERDTTLMLALNSDKDYSLQDCIDRYFESSEVEMKCDKCGKDEKATMTRKIVKRPRIFILNLLRYQTDITESKKKMDKVNIPRYMSIAEYCADDVKAPPYMEPVFMLDREEILQFSYGHSSFMPAQPDISAITRRMKRRQEGALSKQQVSFSPVLIMDNNNEDNLMSPDPPVDGLETTPSSPLNTAGLFPFDESFQNFGSINCDLDGDLLAGKFSDPVPKVIVTDLLEPEKSRLAAWTPWRAQNQLLCPGDGKPKPLCIVTPKNGSDSGLLKTSNPTLNLNEALLSNTMMMQPLTISTDGECFGPSTSSTPDMPMLINLNHLPYDVETESDPFSPNNPMHSNKFDDSLPTRDCDMDFPMCADDTQHMDQNMSNTLPQDGGHGQDSRRFSFSEKEKSDEVADGADQCNGTADEDCSASVGVDKKAGDAEHQSKGQNARLSKGRKVVLSVPDDMQDTKLLVKTLISKFWEVENYIQEYGEEAAMLYVETSSVITEVNDRIEKQRKATEPTNDESGSAANQSDHSPAHQVAVCHLLMNLALGSDEDENETALDDEHCEMICKEIFLTRYSSYDKEDKQRDHLIENLCLYLAAKKLGIAKPDTPKKTMRSPEAARAGHSKDGGEWKDQTQAESPVDSIVNSTESDDEISFKSLPSKDTEGGAVVDEKRKTEHSQSENLGESSSGNRIITVTSVLPKGREKQRGESKAASSLAVSTSHHVRAIPAQQEHQYFGLPNVPNFNLIQDRDFSCYTEEELQSVDLASLTEDEMMQYAQALSKLQYVRDQKAKPDDDCPMELCDLSQDEAMSPNISDLANECDHLSEVLQDSSSLGPSPSGMKLTTESHQSSPHTAAVLQHSVFSDACVPTIKGMAPTQGNEQPNEVQLTCEENLSDLDEPDGLSQIDTPLIKDCYKSKDVVKTDMKNSPKSHSTPARDDYYYDYGMLNQADFGSQPMDMNLSFPESHSLFCDTPSQAKSERQSPKVLLDKCNTSSENGKSHKKISRLDADNGEAVHKSTTDTKCSPSTLMDKLPKGQPDSTDHVVPSSAHPSPRKDSYLFSPSKPNNLTKTRDYSRLRSPSASPRKRNNRTQSRSSSATKKLLFPADERGAKNSANTELESFLDFPKNSFLEVNIDDNFILDRGEDCVITSASVETCRPTAFSPTIRKKLNNSRVISPSVSKHTSKLEPTAAPQPLVESVHAEPAHPKPDAGADSHEPSVSFARVEKFASNEKLQENTNSERSQATGKSRTVRSGCFSSTEEKENDPADLARNKRLENIELGKADFSYRLVGIVNHHGESLYAGHYTAFAYNLSKQKWFYMDDRHTKETTEMTARRDSLNSGYVFFYMDKDLFHEYAEKVGETSASKFQS